MNETPAITQAHRLPGDPTARQLVERFIRVDHAGEHGAVRFYEGQLAVLGRGDKEPILRHMLEQEQRHAAAFSTLVTRRRVRPTALLPLWHAAGFALGAVTAAMGERAAMACTVAVEEAIDEHYAAQHAALGDDEAPLRDKIERFRQEELEHRDHAIAAGAEDVFGYPVMSGLIRLGCKIAIAAAKRI